MTAINGTLLLIYVKGSTGPIAAQTNATLNVTNNVIDTSTKDSGGWAEHINGERSFSVNISSLVSTTGLSAAELIEFITERDDVFLVLKGGIPNPYIAKASIEGVDLQADRESAMLINGTIKGNGPIYCHDTPLITTLGDSDTYDTFTTSGTAVSSAVDAGGGATADSDNVDITDTYKYMFFTFLTLNSGEAPTVGVYSGSGYISNQETLTEGANFIELIATADDATSTIRLENTGATNYALSETYCWEIPV